MIAIRKPFSDGAFTMAFRSGRNSTNGKASKLHDMSKDKPKIPKPAPLPPPPPPPVPEADPENEVLRRRRQQTRAAPIAANPTLLSGSVGGGQKLGG